MFSTPQKRGGASTIFGTPGPATKVPLTKGLFSDGVWHCNCSPRVPATKFQVKKEGRNKGRWFYTCQVSKDDGGCGFFLWEEEAKNREGKVVMGNSRSEKTPEVSRTPERNYTPKPDRAPIAERGSSLVVNLESSESEDDEFGSWPLSPTTEKKVAESTDMTNTSPSPETPRKAPKIAPFTTPGSKRKRDYDYEINDNEPKINMDALPTPITGGGLGRRVISMSEYGNDDEDIFSTPSSLRTASQGNNSFGIRSPSSTPTPFANHFRPPSPTPLDTRHDIAVSSNPYDVTPEVLTLLQDVLLDDETKGRLKSLLGRHAMRVNGIAKGRDITRVALKSKDVKIAELGLRIGQLEAEREVDRKIISGLRNEREGKGKERGRVMF